MIYASILHLNSHLNGFISIGYQTLNIVQTIWICISIQIDCGEKKGDICYS